MTIDEAIRHSEEVAERYERMEDSHDDKLRDECLQCAADHRQLAEWLKELKEAKRLLKLSLEQTNPKCKYCIHDLEEEQSGYNPCCTGETANCKWIYADEAQKLLNQ